MTVSRSARQVWHAIANAAVLGYLAAAAAALVVRHGVRPGWLVVHLLLLGAVTNAIVTWSAHFASALLQLPQPPGRLSAARLVSLNVAILSILSGVEAGQHIVVVAAVALLVVVLAAHAAALARAVHAARGRRFAPTVRFYFVATVALMLGASAGAAIAVGVPPRWQPRLFAAHVQLNLLGWVTLTVLGTLFSLWPAALRTRMVEDLESSARRCLPACAAGLTLIATGVMTTARPVSVVGVLLYLAGVVLFAGPFVRTARRRGPRNPATWMLTAATGWLTIALALDAAAVISTADPQRLADRVESLVPWFVTGFVVQILLGALTYLLPVVLGRGPRAGRRISAVLDRWGWIRIAALNVGVLFLALPSHAARAVGWALCGIAVASFVVLAVAAYATTSRADTRNVPPRCS